MACIMLWVFGSSSNGWWDSITEKNGTVFICINIYIHEYEYIYPKLLLTYQTILGFENYFKPS